MVLWYPYMHHPPSPFSDDITSPTSLLQYEYTFVLYILYHYQVHWTSPKGSKPSLVFKDDLTGT